MIEVARNLKRSLLRRLSFGYSAGPQNNGLDFLLFSRGVVEIASQTSNLSRSLDTADMETFSRLSMAVALKAFQTCWLIPR
jgi:hypothetical protein